MGENRGFRGLVAWQVGMEVVELTYKLTGQFPDQERYGLVSQMRRAAVSGPSNVAEGYPTNAPKWTLRFITIAIGSSFELDTQLEAAVRLQFCTVAEAMPLREQLDRLQKLLCGMKREKERRLLSAGAGVSVALLLLLRVFA
jgi:four helix bundle protein